jgi:CRISPR type III-associated protein (TIGR04423 family)
MRLDTKQQIIEYINNLQNYQGYVQFSDEKIRECDIFKKFQDIKLTPTDGFIYEAHFCNDKESVSIKQINNSWLVSKTDISNISSSDMQEFITDIEKFNYKVKMAQIWEEVEDELCENMKVKKLKKVVFAGFEGDKK